MTITPQGWYPNPEGDGERYWDGQQWTDNYRSAAAPQPQQTWLQRNRNGLIGAAAVLGGLIVLSALVGGNSEQPEQAAPAPTVTVTQDEAEPALPEPAEETVVDETDTNRLALRLTWQTLSADERQQLCWLYTTLPDMAWQSFKEGSDGSISKAEFTRFFDRKCY